MLNCITFYPIENFQKNLAPKFLNIDIKRSLQKLMRQLHVSLLWTSCSFVENVVARKSRWYLATISNTLNSYVLNQTAKFGRLICPKPHSLRGN